jgi:hypothetical protein
VCVEHVRSSEGGKSGSWQERRKATTPTLCAHRRIRSHRVRWFVVQTRLPVHRHYRWTVYRSAIASDCCPTSVLPLSVHLHTSARQRTRAVPGSMDIRPPPPASTYVHACTLLSPRPGKMVWAPQGPIKARHHIASPCTQANTPTRQRRSFWPTPAAVASRCMLPRATPCQPSQSCNPQTSIKTP